MTNAQAALNAAARLDTAYGPLSKDEFEALANRLHALLCELDEKEGRWTPR